MNLFIFKCDSFSRRFLSKAKKTPKKVQYSSRSRMWKCAVPTVFWWSEWRSSDSHIVPAVGNQRVTASRLQTPRLTGGDVIFSL